jgi:hypothetical protein
MPTSQIIFFACWLAVALLGGGVLAFVWERRCAKSDPR